MNSHSYLSQHNQKILNSTAGDHGDKEEDVGLQIKIKKESLEKRRETDRKYEYKHKI